MKKKFIPVIYIKKETVYTSSDCLNSMNKKPEDLVFEYCNLGADEILIYDLSENEEDRELTFSALKKMAFVSEIDLMIHGPVKKMEDVKKYLYTGCSKVLISKKVLENEDLVKEISLKFGKDKLEIQLDSIHEIFLLEESIKEYTSGICLKAEELRIEETKKINFPVKLELVNISLDKILDFLSLPDVAGLTGSLINQNLNSLSALKALCIERNIEIEMLVPKFEWAELKKNEQDMIPVIVQDYQTLEVLMMAYMNEESYYKTLSSGKMTYFSRSRNQLWLKGDTSGHYQYVKSLTTDCDKDTILAKVFQVGAACHTGSYSCFFNEIVKKDYKLNNPLEVFNDVYGVIKDRKINPREGSYTNYLFDKGTDKILKKMGEEATEIVIAAKNPNPDEIKYEISDFLYHMMVLMVEKGVSWEEITIELSRR